MTDYWMLAQAGDGGTGDSAHSAGDGGAAPAEMPDGQPTPVDGETTTGEDGSNPVPTHGDQPKGPGIADMLPLFIVFLLIYVLLFRGPQKKQQQQRKEMLEQLKKGDKVQTIGGIIGHVVAVREDEVTVKIDEATNTKMRVSRQAISRAFEKDEPVKDEANS